LSRLRRRRGLSQKRLAPLLQLSATQISKYELGVNSIPSVTVVRICETLETTTDSLLIGTK
jgi:transcriptional regulator with XRE-family HTH domain